MKNDDLFNRGERLREERKRLDIKTQEDLAEILGVKKNSIVRYEKHNDALTTDQLDKLEDYGFDIGYILWGKRLSNRNEVAADLSEDEQRLIVAYRQTKDEMQAGLVAVAECFAGQFSG
ncbi:helix-turn-helix domain-containing protein [Acinetobacter qingfengensis]|uniref:Transcriptional regulator n=1 Tax=Acinetobacter qingfengensis TaxID=1262585 RepID=A0A1E7R2T4_9GAMM|nr:helix-turn-helix transcriptional regulator [Acinetobacter qingfengensis]KAA8733886.1 helix-turn-helix domain-containing protein [Acinetobacter qingfengensis]OEY93602.1 transcriptional regulator [Acinetobacter qingfengensis]